MNGLIRWMRERRARRIQVEALQCECDPPPPNVILTSSFPYPILCGECKRPLVKRSYI